MANSYKSKLGIIEDNVYMYTIRIYTNVNGYNTRQFIFCLVMIVVANFTNHSGFSSIVTYFL